MLKDNWTETSLSEPPAKTAIQHISTWNYFSPTPNVCSHSRSFRIRAYSHRTSACWCLRMGMGPIPSVNTSVNADTDIRCEWYEYKIDVDLSSINTDADVDARYEHGLKNQTSAICLQRHDLNADLYELLWWFLLTCSPTIKIVNFDRNLVTICILTVSLVWNINVK